MKTFFGKRSARAAIFLVRITVWVALFAAVIGLVMLLWNWLMPALFVGARPIDYWQALGLLLLCKILFGGGRGWRHHRRWDSMSVEERENLRRRFKGRWGSRWSRSFDTESADDATSRPSRATSAEAPPHDTGRQ